MFFLECEETFGQLNAVNKERDEENLLVLSHFFLYNMRS